MSSQQLTPNKRQQNGGLKPVQFIGFDANKSIDSRDVDLIVKEQAIQLLTEFNARAKQFAVVSVVGRYRTGKSYLLNRVLLNQSNGFEVGPTINACTKGLWIWPELVQMPSRDGGTIPAIIMDTEGLGSLEEGENTDLKIFLMSTLISSVMLYNSMGSIDEKAVQGLGLVVNLSKMLQKNNSKTQAHDIVNCFPSFLWIVRDFSLRLENEKGEPMTSTEYLENALKNQKGRPETVDSKNGIRAQLRQLFRERDCFTLIRPTANEKDLQTLNSIPEARLRPQFVAAVKNLRSVMSEKIKPKCFKNKPCTPFQFLQMIKMFVQAINNGAIPAVSSNWDSVCESEAMKTINSFEKKHEQLVSQALSENKPLKEVEAIHKQIILEGQLQLDKSFLSTLEKVLKKKFLKKKLKARFESIRHDLAGRQMEQMRANIQEKFLTVLQEIRFNRIDNFTEVCERLEGAAPTSMVQPDGINTQRSCREQSLTTDQQQSQLQDIYQELYKRIKTLSAEFINGMNERWRVQNEMLLEKQSFYEQNYLQRKAQVQAQLDQLYEKLRFYEVENYRLSVRSDNLFEDLENVKEQLELERSRSLQLEERYQLVDASCLQYQQEVKDCVDKLQHLQGTLTQHKLNDVERDRLCLEWETKAVDAANSLDQQRHNNDLLRLDNHSLRNKVEELQTELLTCLQKKGKHDPAARSLLQSKQNLALMRELQNQKNINEVLVRSMSPNQSSTASVLNQLKSLEQEHSQLKTEHRQLKLFERIVLSCSQFRCSRCQQLLRFDEFNQHECQSLARLQFDVSFSIDSFSRQVVFLIEVQRGDQFWRLSKSEKIVSLLLNRLQQEPLLQVDLAENYETNRLHIAEVLENHADEISRNTLLRQFLGLDIHSRRVPTKQRSYRQTTQRSQRRIHTEVEEQPLESVSELMEASSSSNEDTLNLFTESQQQESPQKTFLKTCRFAQRKQFEFPAW